MITRQLLEQGREVRILVRHNSPCEELAKQGMATPAPSLIEAGAQPVYGGLKDPASLDAACAGIETLITTANSALPGGAERLPAHRRTRGTVVARHRGRVQPGGGA
jgi:uncharacterized protein YbjT (DUF2867 family)